VIKRRTPEEKKYIALRHAELKEKYPHLTDREIAARLGMLVGTLRVILREYRRSSGIDSINAGRRRESCDPACSLSFRCQACSSATASSRSFPIE